MDGNGINGYVKGADKLAKRMGCSVCLARDLLRLAGGDHELVMQASKAVRGVESMKALIIDSRLRDVEGVVFEEYEDEEEDYE